MGKSEVLFCSVLIERKVTPKIGKAISDPGINPLNFLNQIKHISLEIWEYMMAKGDRQNFL